MSTPIRLCYITDRKSLEPKPLLPLIREAVQAGTDLIQIREKDLPTRALLELAESAVAAVKGSRTRIVVNDRLDVALAAAASGVHLGTQSIPPQAVRKRVPEGFLLSVSCHSGEDVRRAEAAGADYVVLGPIFETPSKMAYGPPLGLAALREAASVTRIPILALGGINVGRARECLEAGATGIAGIRVFQDAPRLSIRIRELRAQFS